MAGHTTSKAQAQGRRGKAPATAPSKTTSRAPTETDIAVGERLRRFRLDRGLTLAELGGELGISHQQLQKYEAGTNRISAGMLKLAADVLRVPVQDFFETVPAPDGDKADREEAAAFFERLEDIGRMGARMAHGGKLRPPPRNLQDPPLQAAPIPAGRRAHA